MSKKLNNKFIQNKYWGIWSAKNDESNFHFSSKNVSIANYEPKVFINSIEQKKNSCWNQRIVTEICFQFLSDCLCTYPRRHVVWAYEPIWIISLEFESGWLICFFLLVCFAFHSLSTMWMKWFLVLACKKSIYQWKIACKTDFSNRN